MRSAPIFPGAAEPQRAAISPFKALFRILVGVVVIGSFGVWIYALSGTASQPPPDELDSTGGLIEAIDAGEAYFELEGVLAYGKRAETICQATIDQLGDPSRVESAAERADQLRASNRLLEDMISMLRELPVATERDDSLRTLWLDDWSVLIADRERYADALEIDPTVGFSVSQVADNEGLERRLTRFARTNLMLPCAAPTDVG